MKHQSRWQTVLLVSADILAFCGAFAIAVMMTWVFRAQRIGGTLTTWWSTVISEQFFLYMILALFAIGVMAWRGHYTRRIPFWDELLQLIKLFILFGLLNSMAVLLIQLPISRFLLPILWGSVIVFLPLIRQCFRRFLHKRGYWTLPTVIIGAKQKAREAYRALQSEPMLGFDVCAFIAPEKIHQSVLEIQHKTFPVYGVLEKNIPQIIDELQPINIVIALSADELAEVKGTIEQLGLRYQNIYLIPSVAGLPLFGVETLHFFSHEVLFLKIRNNLAVRSMQIVKRLFDIVAAGLLLCVLSPLLLWIAYRIRQDGGNIVFGHQRIGRHEKYFQCYKFRSMVPNAEEVLAKLLTQDKKAQIEWEKDFKLKNDPRITKIGAFLRRTSLDELPQLWNVLKGEMSLVGPRPIIAEELARYEDKADFYLCARPGLTGLWQVSGRNDISYKERVALDTWYVKNWNLWYDIAILFKTVGVVLKRKGAY